MRALKRKAEAVGVDLDVGTIPTYDGLDATPGEPDRAARLIAHAIARTADRVPVLRKVSRHLEGADTKAGLGSDLIAGAFEIYTRNQVAVEKLLRDYAKTVNEKRMQTRAARQADGNGGTRRSRFGKKPSVPTEVPSDPGGIQ